MGRPLPPAPELGAVPAGGAARVVRVSRWAGSRRGPSRRAWVGSIGVHVAVLATLALGALQRPPELPELIVYRVELFSPPPAEEGPPEPEVSVPELSRVIDVQPDPAPIPQPQPRPVPPPPVDRPPEPVEEAPPPRGPDPDPNTPLPGENLDYVTPGEEFPFPEYLENIVRQAQRYFRWRGTRGLSAEVYFVIRRDGSVQDIRILRSSGNVSFDIQAEGAIEAASRARAFGPLPSGYQADALPVAIEFQPQ